MDNLIDGLVIGTRKAGTTWLYENFKLDSDFLVSEKVKESGFFSKELIQDYDIRSYTSLIDYSDKLNKLSVEVDSSIVYSKFFSENINIHAPESSVVLILRNPIDFLVSRIIHSIRKGIIENDSIELIMKKNNWLIEELDYESMLTRFNDLKTENKIILPFELLNHDQKRFYSIVKSCLRKHKFIKDYDSPILEKINVSRVSKMDKVTVFLTRMGKLFRSYGMHNIVNYAKDIGFHKLIEKETSKTKLIKLRSESERFIKVYAPKSLTIWKEINDDYI